MTRRSDLMLEDLLECDHLPAIPISENGDILYLTEGGANPTEPKGEPNA